MCCACRPALRVRSAVRVSVSLCMLHDAHPHGHGVPGCGAPPPCWECMVSGPRGESERQRTRPWKKRGCKTPGEILALWQGAVLICAPVSVHVCVTRQRLSASSLAPWLPGAARAQLKASQEMKEVLRTLPVPPCGWAPHLPIAPHTPADPLAADFVG